jgi:hypothetical protein
VPYAKCLSSVSFTVSGQPPQVPQWLWIAIVAVAGVAVIGAVATVLYNESEKHMMYVAALRR